MEPLQPITVGPAARAVIGTEWPSHALYALHVVGKLSRSGTKSRRVVLVTRTMMLMVHPDTKAVCRALAVPDVVKVQLDNEKGLASVSSSQEHDRDWLWSWTDDPANTPAGVQDFVEVVRQLAERCGGGCSVVHCPLGVKAVRLSPRRGDWDLIQKMEMLRLDSRLHVEHARNIEGCRYLILHLANSTEPLGLDLSELATQDGPKLRIDGTEPLTPAARAGVGTGLELCGVNGVRTTTLAAVRAVVERSRQRGAVEIGLSLGEYVDPPSSGSEWEGEEGAAEDRAWTAQEGIDAARDLVDAEQGRLERLRGQAEDEEREHRQLTESMERRKEELKRKLRVRESAAEQEWRRLYSRSAIPPVVADVISGRVLAKPLPPPEDPNAAAMRRVEPELAALRGRILAEEQRAAALRGRLSAMRRQQQRQQQQPGVSGEPLMPSDIGKALGAWFRGELGADAGEGRKPPPSKSCSRQSSEVSVFI